MPGEGAEHLWGGLRIGHYQTILADPPWDYPGPMGIPTRVGRVTRNRGVISQYASMTTEQIQALPVQRLAAPECHLYLWVTNGFLHDGFHVLDAWGFDYKACLTWNKTGHLGLGYWFRNQTEHILFAVRGKRRTRGTSIKTNFTARKRGHSAKPEEAFQIMEAASYGPRVELFARERRAGWDCWGDQVSDVEPLPFAVELVMPDD